MPYQDFAAPSGEVTARREEASRRPTRQRGREIRYRNAAQHRQDDIARAIAARDPIPSGRSGVRRRVDPGRAFPIHTNHPTRQREIPYRPRPCLHRDP